LNWGFDLGFVAPALEHFPSLGAADWAAGSSHAAPRPLALSLMRVFNWGTTLESFGTDGAAGSWPMQSMAVEAYAAPRPLAPPGPAEQQSPWAGW
jgi:hypothetical protein